MAEDIPLRAHALGRKRDEVALELAARLIAEIDAIDRVGEQAALPALESAFNERRTVLGALKAGGSPMVTSVEPVPDTPSAAEASEPLEVGSKRSDREDEPSSAGIAAKSAAPRDSFLGHKQTAILLGYIAIIGTALVGGVFAYSGSTGIADRADRQAIFQSSRYELDTPEMGAESSVVLATPQSPSGYPLGQLRGMPAPAEAESASTFTDAVLSAFRTTNIIGSAFAQERAPRYERDIQGRPVGYLRAEGFHPLSDENLEGYEDFALRFVSINTRAQSDALKRQIDRERDDHKAIRDAGVLGWLAATFALVLDPRAWLAGLLVGLTWRWIGVPRSDVNEKQW